MSNSRADNTSEFKRYRTQRPDYPPEIVSFILEHCIVDEDWRIADIGSGAGVSTRLLSRGLKRTVFAIEPDDRLRRFAEENEGDNPYFHSVKGTAENTTLVDRSVNLVCAFQSFQWFDKGMARKEFRRILRSPKRILVAFSKRVIDEKGFSPAYEGILAKFPEYHTAMRHNATLDEFKEFLENNVAISKSFFVTLNIDWEGLADRFASAYYTPKKGTTEYYQSIDAMRSVFETHNHNGLIEIRYETQVYLGVLG
jgi:SAM-dependent methyltransferase